VNPSKRSRNSPRTRSHDGKTSLTRFGSGTRAAGVAGGAGVCASARVADTNAIATIAITCCVKAGFRHTSEWFMNSGPLLAAMKRKRGGECSLKSKRDAASGPFACVLMFPTRPRSYDNVARSLTSDRDVGTAKIAHDAVRFAARPLRTAHESIDNSLTISLLPNDASHGDQWRRRPPA
jgi:hypothetical protein